MADKSDRHYSEIRSINNDLVLLGNALMTRNNDIHSIHDFVAASINALSTDDLKEKMNDLNERVIDCVNDDDRLRTLTVMQHALAQEALPFLSEERQQQFDKLSIDLAGVNVAKGDDLKARVARFQVDLLKFVPEIEEEDHSKLANRTVEVVEATGKEQVARIDALYEEINLLVQPPVSFD